MPRASPRFKQADVTRALRGAKAAGFDVGQVRILPDGAILIDATKDIKSEAQSAFDEWKAADARKA